MVILAAILAAVAAGMFGWSRTRGVPGGYGEGTVVASERVGDLVVTLLAPDGQLRPGTSELEVRFTSASTGQSVDVGRVALDATMPMPGMMMTSAGAIAPGAGRGTYNVRAEFGMAGTWSIRVRWDGPAGQGTAAMSGEVR